MNCKEKLRKLKDKSLLVTRFLQNMIWPALEGEPEDPGKVPIDHFKKRLEETKELGTTREMYKLAKGIAAEERERYQGITRKVFTLLGATGIVSAIIVGFSKFLLIDTAVFPIYIHIIICLLYAFGLIYFCTSILFSLRALSVGKFYVLGPNDISENSSLNEETYLKNILSKIFVFTEKNYRVTNEKIDWFILAREFFLRGVVTLVLLGVVIVICSILLRFSIFSN